MSVIPVEKPEWGHIDTVLLDLDGTLLDLAYDNHFWLEIVPTAYAAARTTTVDAARTELAPLFRAREGTLPWYCIDHWSRELDLDIDALKRANTERIAWLPGAENFLLRLRTAGKRVVLLTNSHPRVLRIKDEKTGVLRYFDAAFTSHDFGVAKETPEFWEAVRAVEPFDLRRSLFADDSASVLRAAQRAGIRWIYGVRRPDSVQTVRDHVDVAVIDGVHELM
ncbi:MAG TPA: GMP/IMP nucleotidase [Steroidobacteraceae bacterium]